MVGQLETLGTTPKVRVLHFLKEIFWCPPATDLYSLNEKNIEDT